MPIIDAALFGEVQLAATTESFDYLRCNSDTLSAIAPFLQNVTLSPSKYNVDLDLIAFKEVGFHKEGTYKELEASACSEAPLDDEQFSDWTCIANLGQKKSMKSPTCAHKRSTTCSTMARMKSSGHSCSANSDFR